MSPAKSSSPLSSDNTGKVRLQKILAAAGLGSRRGVEELITAGRVTVDGETITSLGTTVDPETQKIYCDGERLKPQRKEYYLVNKPTGYLCTNNDPSGRPRAIDLVPQSRQRLFTVGRLDEGSHGLLLITNDGDLAQRLLHPKFEVTRTYKVQVAGIPTPETLRELMQGQRFTEGHFQFHRARKLKTHGQSAFLEVELKQGKNREIRRLLARVGHKVVSLQRIAFGPLRLGRLPVGQSRSLRGEELKKLKDFAFGSKKPAGKRSSTKPAKMSRKRSPHRK
ncbi:pseudouridine synthase [Calycomorphotria hydatis]|uniref:Pseudouridine synthase n=1 Tax=Calycomorphotria hydatis TaxID=2528027 RepID=A0A517T7U0_9PLAN|nr:pseudouridine synthase [Calycomorphotria hydatis]QDT64439.1 Ribosomal large subunit pseudouridine synthase B [Calycomorphotria hydatis]